MSSPFVISRLALEAGAEIALCRLPGSVTPLELDIEAICTHGVSCVVSLTPTEEMRLAGGGQLPLLLQEHGMAWYHFPVIDYGVPAAHQAEDWERLAASLHLLLDRGERVLIHCLAGIGRSGMAAMRLLVERGLSPADALTQVRKARPGAVERQAQFDWAAKPPHGLPT